jgi:metal-sulfur cluster biosynthetic enzyme
MQTWNPWLEGMMIENDTVLEALKTVIDPELGLNIVDLGLIYHEMWEMGPGRVEILIRVGERKCALPPQA